MPEPVSVMQYAWKSLSNLCPIDAVTMPAADSGCCLAFLLPAPFVFDAVLHWPSLRWMSLSWCLLPGGFGDGAFTYANAGAC
jgi:hypothetical protein